MATPRGLNTTKGRTLRFKSKLEGRFATILENNGYRVNYEQTKLRFVQPSKNRLYTVDFDAGDLLLETKGRLTTADREKMKLVVDQHPDKKIIMVFDNPNKRLSKTSKTTYSMWCDKHNIKWLKLADIEKDISKLCQLSSIPLQKVGSLKTQPKKKSKPLK